MASTRQSKPLHAVPAPPVPPDPAHQADADPASAHAGVDAALSHPAREQVEQAPFSVSEEVSFDQQSDAARRVGQLPPDAGAPGPQGMPPQKAMAEALQPPDGAEGNVETGGGPAQSNTRPGTAGPPA